VSFHHSPFANISLLIDESLESLACQIEKLEEKIRKEEADWADIKIRLRLFREAVTEVCMSFFSLF
jgi:hypothetical protein